MTERRVLYVRQRLAAPAPDRPSRADNRLPSEIDTVLVQWGSWCRSRHHFGAPRTSLQSTLAPLRIRSTVRPEGPGVACSAEMAQLHQVIMGLSKRERTVLEVVYLHRLRPVTTIAERMGISRVTFYRTLKAAAVKAHAMSQSPE